jgi:hypothetical protein
MPTSLSSLHRLIYISEATDFTVARAADIMADILAVSVERNTQAGVSGALLACDQWFLQVLEGSRLKVSEIYNLLCTDPRHRKIRLIEAKPAERRLFCDWGMCGRTLSSRDAEIVALLGARGRLNPATLTPASAVKLLSVVREVQKRPTVGYV